MNMQAFIDPALRPALWETSSIGPASGSSQSAGVPGFLHKRGERCDSSDCLYCQYQDDCSLHGNGRLCTLLRKRSLQQTRINGRFSISGQPERDALESVQEGRPVTSTSLPRPSEEFSYRFRRQRTSSTDYTGLRFGQTEQLSSALASSSPQLDTHDEPSDFQQEMCKTAWHYSDQFTTFAEPPPVHLVQVAELGLPAQPVSHDMICAMEFSADGRMLVTGSMAKQVRLYSISELFQDTAAAGQAWRRESLSAPNSSAGLNEELEAQEIQHNQDSDYDSLDEDRERGADDDDVSGWALRKRRQRARMRRGGSGHDRLRRQQSAVAGVDPAAPLAVHRLPSKISCLAWSHSMDGVITIGDYDGVITQLHVCSGHQLGDVDAHAGRRIWGIAHSKLQPNLCASASDDGTARIWSGPCIDTCAAVLQPQATGWGSTGKNLKSGRSTSVCGVDFSSTHEHVVALASADHNAYIYDIRHTQTPLLVLKHHARPVSYIRFFGNGQVVTASTDASLAVWDVSSSVGEWLTPVHTVTGHDLSPAAAPSVPVQMLQPVVAQYQQTSAADLGSGSNRRSSMDSDDLEMDERHRRRGKVTSQARRPPGLPVAVVSLPPGHSPSSQAQHNAVHGHNSSMHDAEHISQQREGTPTLTSHALQLSPSVSEPPRRLFRGHKNEKNFVGLAVRPEDGLLAVGSENSNVFAYHQAWSTPLATCDLYNGRVSGNGVVSTWQQQQAGGSSRMSLDVRHSPFVSAVAWQSAAASQAMGLPALLAAATSRGDARILMLKDPSRS